MPLGLGTASIRILALLLVMMVPCETGVLWLPSKVRGPILISSSPVFSVAYHGEESYEETQSRYTRASAFTSSAMKNHPVDPTFRDDLSHDRIPAMATRPRETTPDLVRNDTSTPELHGSPKRAAVAELASPGPPRIIEISKPRPNSRTYKAYRPDAQLHPLYDASGANLGRESVAPLAERYQRPHVDGWTRWNRDS